VHRAAPPAANVQQRHSRLEVELAQRQIEFGVLRLFEAHIIALEVCAGVSHGAVKE
jgi:hypothetical protein